MNTIKYLAISSIAAAALGAAAMAHGGHSNSEENAAGQPGDPKAVSSTVRIEAGEIKFDVRKLTFRVGQTVKFIVVNKGEQDHELTIGDHITQLEHRKTMAEMAEAEGGMSTGEMHGHSHAVGSAVTVKPGETKELVWQFTKPGSFEFACNFPGHAEAGMAGTIDIR